MVIGRIAPSRGCPAERTRRAGFQARSRPRAYRLQRSQRVRRPSRHHHGETGMNLVLNPPLLGFIVGTRAALAFGVGLLLADRIPESRRRAIALSLIGFGAATTIPALRTVWSRNNEVSTSRRLHQVADLSN